MDKSFVHIPGLPSNRPSPSRAFEGWQYQDLSFILNSPSFSVTSVGVIAVHHRKYSSASIPTIYSSIPVTRQAGPTHLQLYPAYWQIPTTSNPSFRDLIGCGVILAVLRLFYLYHLSRLRRRDLVCRYSNVSITGESYLDHRRPGDNITCLIRYHFSCTACITNLKGNIPKH